MLPFKKPHHTSDPDCVIPHPQAGGGYLIKPRGLNIVWGNDSRYWKLYGDTAELIQVSWLEVSGIVPVAKNKKYNIRFHVNVKANGFGWNSTQVLVMAKVGKKGRYTFKESILKPGDNLTIPYDSLEIEVGANASDNNLHFGLYEVWSGKWKGGLVIIDAEVVPVN